MTAFAVYQLGASVGLAVGPVIGGMLATRSFTPLFLGDAATSCVWGMISLISLPRTSPTGRLRGSVFHGPFRDRIFVRFWISSLLVNVLVFQAHSTFPLWLSDHGYSSTVYGSLLGLNGALMGVFQLPLTRWTRRFPAHGECSLLRAS